MCTDQDMHVQKPKYACAQTKPCALTLQGGVPGVYACAQTKICMCKNQNMHVHRPRNACAQTKPCALILQGGVPGYCRDRVLRAAAGGEFCKKFDL